MLQIKKLETSEDAVLFQELLKVFAQVFEREDSACLSAGYLQDLITQGSVIVYVAIEQGIVLGGLTAYELPMYYAKGAEIFLYDIGVRAESQRRGVGRALLLALQKYSQDRGIVSLFVAADEEDTHALDFYQSTGGRAAKVRHYSYDIPVKIG